MDKFLIIVPSYSPLKSLSFFIDFSLILRDFRASLFLHTVHTDLYMSTYLPSLLCSFLLLDFWFPSEIIFLLPKADFYNFSWNCLFFFPCLYSGKYVFSVWNSRMGNYFLPVHWDFYSTVFWLSLLGTILEIGSINPYHLVKVFILWRCLKKIFFVGFIDVPSGKVGHNFPEHHYLK